MSNPDRRIIDGRPLINRAELRRAVGIGESTAERWWRNRDENGHPAPALVDGRRLLWDEAELLDFARAQEAGAARAAEDEIVIDGRRLISRRGLARALDMREQSLADLYVRRAENGHPEAVQRIGRRWYWDKEQMLTWDQDRKAAMKAMLTEVDHSGDPDELVDISEAARILNYTHRQTISSFRSRNPGYFPDPDGEEDGSDRWKRRTVWAFGDEREHRGRGGRRRAAANDSPSTS